MITPFSAKTMYKCCGALDVYRNQSNAVTSTWQDNESSQLVDAETSTGVLVVSWMRVLHMALEIVLSLETVSGKLAPWIRA